MISSGEGSAKPVVSLTAARGRGKSASLGLCVAGAIAYGYSNIFVTAPALENLFTTFSVLLDGLKALKYVEHTDFEVVYHSQGGGDRHLKIPLRIDIFKKHKQTVRYFEPTALEALSGADILAIDEAASIPLPSVREIIGSLHHSSRFHCAWLRGHRPLPLPQAHGSAQVTDWS